MGVDRENAKQTLNLISAVDGSAAAITCDVSEPASVATLKNAVEVNIRRCDILMNNARIYPAQRFDARSLGQSRFNVSDDKSFRRRHATARVGAGY